MKQSSTASVVPTAGQLLLGEIAINTTDGKMFIKKGDNSIVQVGAGGVADTANTLANTRSISLGGEASGTTNFDGSKNVTITTTIPLLDGGNY